MDMKLEVIPVPVRDVDAAKDFYTRQVGFHLDHDVRPNENMRVVQMTPPGSACSVVIGEGLPLGEPGSVKGVQLVVEDPRRCPQQPRQPGRRHQRRPANGAQRHPWLTLLLP
jgi:catechol 2,3-dioxygenase-like lactoylglutathione lyase family enzyme